MVRVKICGITSELDAERAARAGAWAIGFIFYKKSPRFISPFKAKKIIDALPPFITPVGVFVNHNAGAMRDIIGHCGLRAVQLAFVNPFTKRRVDIRASKEHFLKHFGFSLAKLPPP